MNTARGSKVAPCINLVAEKYSNSDPSVQVCVCVCVCVYVNLVSYVRCN